MPPLVKGKLWLDLHALPCHCDLMQQRGYMPVIPDVVRTPSIDWNCGNRCDFLCMLRRILNLHIQQLYIVPGRDKACDR